MTIIRKLGVSNTLLSRQRPCRVLLDKAATPKSIEDNEVMKARRRPSGSPDHDIMYNLCCVSNNSSCLFPGYTQLYTDSELCFMKSLLLGCQGTRASHNI